MSIAIDTPDVGGGGEIKKIPPPLPMPAIDLILANTSTDVFLGG